MAITMTEALGGEFTQAYQEGLRKNRIKRLDVAKVKDDIIDSVVEKMKGDTPQIFFPYGTNEYHIVLVEIPRELKPTGTKYGNIKQSVLWQGKWVSAFLDEVDFNRLQVNTPVIFAGRMKRQQMENGTISYSMSVHGLITLDDVQNRTNAKKAEKEAVDNKVNAFK